jgi:hypothetical protein
MKLSLLTVFYFSLSVLATKSGLEEEVELRLVQDLIEYVKVETDEQCLYRAIVAIGTLVRQSF